MDQPVSAVEVVEGSEALVQWRVHVPAHDSVKRSVKVSVKVRHFRHSLLEAFGSRKERRQQIGQIVEPGAVIEFAATEQEVSKSRPVTYHRTSPAAS